MDPGAALSALGPWCETVSASIDNPEVTFAALYQQHAPAVYRFSLCLVGDPLRAEELTSEAFFRAWARRDSITQSTMRSYLFTIAKNVYRDQLRKSKREIALTQDYVDTSSTADQTFERSQEYLLLNKLIGELSELDREIITLRYQEDLSHEEIADIVGMNAASVRIRAFRARQKLLQAYAEKAKQ
jgi:RNA polymerase sigma-70 factor (ECF subfamily)